MYIFSKREGTHHNVHHAAPHQGHAQHHAAPHQEHAQHHAAPHQEHAHHGAQHHAVPQTHGAHHPNTNPRRKKNQQNFDLGKEVRDSSVET